MGKLQSFYIFSLIVCFGSASSAELLFGVGNSSGSASNSSISASASPAGDLAQSSSGNGTDSPSLGPALLPIAAALAAILAANPNIGDHGASSSDDISSASRDNIGVNLGSVELCEQTQEHTLSMQGPGTSNCYDRMDKNFATFFKKEFVNCIKEVAITGDVTKPTIVIKHMGIFANRNARNSKVLSTHAAGRAIDISKILINGKPFSMHEKNHDRRYDKLRLCWQRKGKEFARKNNLSPRSCAINSIGHPHSHRPSNKLHRDHLHVSFNCPRLKGYAKF